MKVLLTGASGFVGSHILDSLRARNCETVLLLRNASNTTFLGPHLSETEIRLGSVTDPKSLAKATEGISHVIHCAGCTKALRVSEFYEINRAGTRNVVEALNQRAPGVRRLVHISSLAVSGPGTPEKPAKEDAPPRPVSDYGKSKLAAELEVRERSRTPYTVIRPPAVYGPRDTGFLSLFKAVKHHVLPRPNQNQALSLVYAKDLAEAVVECLTHPGAVGKTYFAAGDEVVSGASMASEIAAQMKKWTIPFPLPSLLLWVVCLVQQALSQLTRRASLLNLQKYAELRAPGWVCDASKLHREIGIACPTGLKQGITQTLDWYRREHWL